MANDIVISGEVIRLIRGLAPKAQAAAGMVALQQQLADLQLQEEQDALLEEERRSLLEEKRAEREHLESVLRSFGSPDGRGGRVLGFASSDEANKICLDLRNQGLKVFEDLVPLYNGGIITIIRAVMPK